ncbi:hypothetical protein PMAYCL1PPCAC_05107, partial [Pristionchus mayeri]
MGMYRNYAEGRAYARINFPSLYHFFEDPKFHAFAYDMGKFPEYAIIVVASIIILMIVASLSNLLFVFGSFYLPSRQNASMSDKTRNIQKKLITLLVYQVF